MERSGDNSSSTDVFFIIELLIAPFVPSNTARGGGIIMPVVHSIAQTLGSTPSHHPEMGGFLMLLGSHANLLSASMYLTGQCAMRSLPFCIQRPSCFFFHRNGSQSNRLGKGKPIISKLELYLYDLAFWQHPPCIALCPLLAFDSQSTHAPIHL
jgi:hypothetical protein